MASAPASLPADTALGPVSLTVADLAGVTGFYERAIGLSVIERDGDVVRLGPAGGEALVELVGRPDAPPRAPHASGLFHLALLYPERAELARALRRLVGAGWRLTGASDHLVSEALYTADPEGNGIELYRDRPREEWRRQPNGELEMATIPLDLDDLVAQLPDADEPDAGAPPATRIGHVHLQVSDLAPAERFYAQALGLDVMVRSFPGALFLASGGYHHHVGANTWSSAGGPPADPAARGLRHFTVELPAGEPAAGGGLSSGGSGTTAGGGLTSGGSGTTAAGEPAQAGELRRVADRVAGAGFAVEAQPDGSELVRDPFRIGVLLRAGASG
jgi:catechol 2,3-dioxygenase